MHALTVLVAAEAVDAASDLLSDEHDALSVSIEDADAGSPAEQPVFDEPGTGGSRIWRRARLSALFDSEAAATAAAAALAAGAAGHDARIETIAPVDDRDWVRLTQAQFGPTEIEPGFWIVPTWSAVPTGAVRTIRLDPGMAFGTGTHPTTRMCLRWIVRQSASRPAAWPRVLDYGCGSGVLAIAAGLLGAGSIDAVDIDPAAVETTRANAAANAVTLRAHAADGAVGGEFDLILANILATPLKMLAPLLANRLAPGGELVLSGILAAQAGELKASYAPWLALEVADQDDGWILMTGARPAPARVA
ncbi:MAG: 50S ribosomal protein L11 methyltransferase [Burkholderiales bacterium]|nr:50S ribosomal protein L11 methyltransferase [Burkholderiales bacterium]